jgi:hypothetical protein
VEIAGKSLFFPTGLPPLSISFNGNTKFELQYNQEKGVGERKRVGAISGNLLRITSTMGQKPDITNQNFITSFHRKRHRPKEDINRSK